MASWVVDLLFACLICVLWTGESTSFYISLCWAVSRGDHLGVSGCAALEGGLTLGVGTTLGGTTLGGSTLGG